MSVRQIFQSKLAQNAGNWIRLHGDSQKCVYVLLVACYSAVVIQYCENDEERKEGKKERIEKLFFFD